MRTFTRRPVGEEYRLEYIPFDLINVIIQARKTFTQIPEMANSLSAKGILGFPQVACYDKRHCREYLNVINRKWSTDYKLSDLESFEENGKTCYFILIDGERRYRGLELLLNYGCDVCRQKYGEEGCLERHFPYGIPFIIRENVPPIDALCIQYSSNSHCQVPLHEEAEGLVRFYHLLLSESPKLTKKAFSGMISRPANLITRALRYMNLPFEIQQNVIDGDLSVENAIHLARLMEAGFSADELLYYRDLVWSRGYKPTQTARMVVGLLDSKKNEQLSLMDIPCDEESEIVRSLEQNTVKFLEELAGYFNGSTKVLAKNSRRSPFTSKRSVKALKTMLSEQEELIPHLRKVLGEEKKVRKVHHHTQRLAENLDLLIPDKGEQ